MKTNKKLIEELVEYFSKQDQKIVCRFLANAMIDLHRIRNISTLPAKELESLLFRIEHNSDELIKFSKYGVKTDLKLQNIE